MPQNIPGVWDYLYRNETNPGANFTAAFSAASRARTDKGELEQRAESLKRQRELDAQRVQERAEELARQEKWRGEDIKRSDAAHFDVLAGRYGEDVALHPDGTVDVQGSERMHLDHVRREKMAEELAMREALTGAIEIDQDRSLRDLPGYSTGRTKASQAISTQHALDERARAAAQSRMDVARERSSSKGASVADPSVVIQPQKIGGWWHTWDGKKWVPASQEVNQGMNRDKKAVESPNSPQQDILNMRRKEGGGWERR